MELLLGLMVVLFLAVLAGSMVTFEDEWTDEELSNVVETETLLNAKEETKDEVSNQSH